MTSLMYIIPLCFIAITFIIWFYCNAILNEVKKGNKKIFVILEQLNLELSEVFRELNQDAGDIKRRATWSKKREKKTLKKI